MKLLPRTLFGQILAALLVGLLAAQIAGFWLVLDDRARMGERLLGAYAAQRLAGILNLLDQAEPAERVKLVKALNVPPTHLALDEEWGNPSAENAVFTNPFGRQLIREPSRTPDDDGISDANGFVAQIIRELPRPMPVQVLSIKLWEPRRPLAGGDDKQITIRTDGDSDRRLRLNRPLLSVVGQAKLGDGAVVTFRHSLPQQGLDWPLRLLGWLVVLVLSVAALSIWTVRRLTRPLTTLADAAAGLARNLEQPPLPENGPEEIARAALAFNAMQRDIKRYLDTRAQILAGVSHDLRLPLTRIRLRIENLGDETLRTQIENDLGEMDQMISNTLEYLRAGGNSEKTVRLDLNALLESLAEDMATLGAEVHISGTIAEPYAGRPLALRRCLANLLDNARRYGGGIIDIGVATTPAGIRITVADRGPGIPSAELENVCEPYVRIESSRARHTGGSGLGLAIARSIARGHGGDLVLSPRPGGGLLATVTLGNEVH